MPRPFEQTDGDELAKLLGPPSDLRRLPVDQASEGYTRGEEAFRVATSDRTTAALMTARGLIPKAGQRQVRSLTRREWWGRFAGWAVAGGIAAAAFKAVIAAKRAHGDDQ